MSNQNIQNALNQLVADLSQMSALVHQTHWYMRGKGFLTLHPLMDDFRDDIEEQLDEVAERLITIGGSPYSTLPEFAEHSEIELETVKWGQYSMEEYMERLAKNYKVLVDAYEAGIKAAQEDEDTPSEDMLIGFKGDTEKRVWMIEAQLGTKPGLN